MIEGFHHKGLRRLFKQDDARAVKVDQVERLRLILLCWTKPATCRIWTSLRFGYIRRQLYNVMQGKSGVTPEMALRFEKAFGGSADMWLRMQGAFDLAHA